MSTTIKDVAAHCGIDPATVERALGPQKGDLDAETLARVLDSVVALGYTTAGRSRTLGILYADESGRGLTHPFFLGNVRRQMGDAFLRNVPAGQLVNGAARVGKRPGGVFSDAAAAAGDKGDLIH